MFIQISQPRISLIKCLSQQVVNSLRVQENSIIQLLSEVALVQEDLSLPECVYRTENDLVAVIHSEESALSQLAHIRLRHYIGWNLYTDEMKAILEEEARIFCELILNELSEMPLAASL